MYTCTHGQENKIMSIWKTNVHVHICTFYSLHSEDELVFIFRFTTSSRLRSHAENTILML